MHVPPEVHDSADQVGLLAAEDIAAGIESAAEAARSFVLGCPSGRSPLRTYAHLADLVAQRNLDLSHLIIALMDEYVVRTADGFKLVDPELPHSCVGFGRRQILEPLNAAAGPGHRIQAQNLWYPDPAAEPGAYDDTLAAAGGIDLFLLASGASDGHIALNPPGTATDSVTRVVELGEDTRRDNLETFPSFRQLDDVPRYGVTVGTATIRDLSRAVVMVVTGAHKQVTVQRVASADSYEPDWPATVLSDCASPRFLADRAAATLLSAAS
ncbi:glucosamine-6-phosphate deaminase [Kribbella aluminosa]|uniref:Glucosamine-6-phosphate deaminase n=1 Tax=Kribbella aluminosa TaxID=416017 RepID=A0ABS4UJ44_9ACTN|nr:6-phosphogluconolactonase [Kribbella aluminosa]MBP2351640.1 glucosamine-6-phosphate deaminase [Kribbella aluminosa]